MKMHDADCNCMENLHFDDCNSETLRNESNVHEWTWDTSRVTPKTVLSNRNLEVLFHPGYSNGTAVMQGNTPFEKGRHYYWEIQMLTPPYGTDVMVGVGTNKVNLRSQEVNFCSFLGMDKESWGFSYRGLIHHGGNEKQYPGRFEQGSIVGVHLDTFRGTLQFFVDKKPSGVAFTGLRDQVLYPMVCSTAAQSKMRITHCSSMPASLQMECLAILQPSERAYLSKTFPILRELSESIFAEILHKDYNEDEFDNYNRWDLDEFDFILVGCKRRRMQKLFPI